MIAFSNKKTYIKTHHSIQRTLVRGKQKNWNQAMEFLTKALERNEILVETKKIKYIIYHGLIYPCHDTGNNTYIVTTALTYNKKRLEKFERMIEKYQ